MFGRSRSIKLLSIAGIRIGVSGSWFVMLFLLIFLLSGPFRDTLHSSEDVAYLTTVVTVLLFFGSLILHELGHAIVARREGIGVHRIELFLFGGTTYMDRDAQSPGEEFRIAIAGPLGTLLFVLICLGVDVLAVGPHRLIDAVTLGTGVQITPLLLALSWLVPMNVLILFFNLVPAYPLDGGRVARAVVWRVTGDQLRGTRAAARLGEGFALLLGAFGIFITAHGSNFEGIWLLMLAFMLWQSARTALGGTAAAARVQTVRVAEIMDHEPVVIAGTSPLQRALDEAFHRYQMDWLPVIDGDGRFIGIARRERAEELVYSGHGEDTVGSILEPGDIRQWQVGLDRPLTDVLTLDALRRLGGVVATDEYGLLRGVLTLDQIRRALQNALGSPTGG